MKTYKNLFERICCFKNLHSAYLKARKCKRYRDYVLELSYRLEENLLRLQRELLNQTYHHGPYREFVVSDSKKRRIKAAPFRDRIVHHALCNIIEPIFDKGFTHHSYACRYGKGTHKTIKKLQKYIEKLDRFRERRQENAPLKTYCLQGDISKYFDSIDHQVLLELIKKKIGDQKTIWLIEEILGSCYSRKIYKNLFDVKKVGIPIGNLTSQLFANIYLNKLDQFVKHQLKIKYYLRYMDDFLILDFSKNKLHQIKSRLQKFLKNELRLELNPRKINIFPIKNGIYFLGYCIFRDYKLLRKDTVRRFIKRTKFYQKRVSLGLMSKEKFATFLQSWIAYAEFGNSWRLRKRLNL